VHLEGLTIVAPFGRWQVVEACSGLDYVLVFGMAGGLFAALALRSWRSRVLFFLVALLLAVLANALRAWAIVYAVYLRGGVDQDHSLIGWSAFGVGFAALCMLGMRLQPAAAPSAPAPVVARSPATATGVLAGVLALLLAAAAPLGLAALHEAAHGGAASLDGCRSIDSVMGERAGVALLRTRTECAGPAGRRRLPDLAQQAMRVPVPTGMLVNGRRPVTLAGTNTTFMAATLSTLGDPEAYRMTYWYEIDGSPVADRLALKWRLALAQLQGRDAHVVLTTELEGPLGAP